MLATFSLASATNSSDVVFAELSKISDSIRADATASSAVRCANSRIRTDAMPWSAGLAFSAAATLAATESNSAFASLSFSSCTAADAA